MFKLLWALHVFHWAHLCLPALIHMSISSGSEKKTVFGSLPLCSIGHNRCLLLSVPNKGAFINGWWPTWCLVMTASLFHCPQNGDPLQMLPIPVLHLTVRIDLSIHPADLTVPCAWLFLKSYFNVEQTGHLLRKYTFDLCNNSVLRWLFYRPSVT